MVEIVVVGQRTCTSCKKCAEDPRFEAGAFVSISRCCLSRKQKQWIPDVKLGVTCGVGKMWTPLSHIYVQSCIVVCSLLCLLFRIVLY